MGTPPTQEPPERGKAQRLDEDELADLPPMDGGDEDGAPAEVGVDELGDDPGESRPVDFDDAAVGGDLGLDVAVEGAEGGWLEGADDPAQDDAQNAWALEDGEALAASERAEPRLLDDADEPGVGEEDFGLGDGSSAALDGGEEGPAAEQDGLSEAELPPLDADNEGDLDDEAVMDPLPGVMGLPGLAASTDEGEGGPHPWDDRAWQRAFPPLRAGPLRALAGGLEGVVAGGRVLVTSDHDGRCMLPEASGLSGSAVERLACRGLWVAVGLEDGRVLASDDGGRSFVAAPTFAPGAEARRPVAGLAFDADGTLWLLTSAGRLVTCAAAAEWKEPARGRRFVALLQEGEGVVALGAADGSEELAPVPGARVVTLPPLPSRIRLAPGIPLDQCGPHLAVVVADVGVFRGRRGGAWERLEGTFHASALAFVGVDGTLVTALHGESEGRSWLLRAPPGAGAGLRIVAEVGGDEGDDGGGRVAALRWDSAGTILWAAGSFGLASFRG